VGLLAWSLLPLLSRLRVTPPQVSLSKDQLRPGEQFVLSYQQDFRSPVEVNQAMIRLVLRESARYRRGTNTYTATHEHVIHEFQLPAKRYEAGESLSDRHTLEIPPDAMHSFEASNNKLLWLITVHVGVKGWPDFKEEYGLTVLPERMP
jgi:hypothetical protein